MLSGQLRTDYLSRLLVQVVAADIPAADFHVDGLPKVNGDTKYLNFPFSIGINGVNSGEQVLNVTVNITQVASLLIKLEADVSRGTLSE